MMEKSRFKPCIFHKIGYFCTSKIKTMNKLYLLLSFVLLSSFLTAQVYLDISAEQAKDTIEANIDNPNFTILDVRTPAEYLPAHIEGAFHRDFYDDDFEMQMDSLDKSRTYLIYCASGGRSGATLDLVETLEFDRVYNMLGGMTAWNAAGYPVTDEIPEYVDIYGTSTSTVDLKSYDISVFPNPVTNYLNVETAHEIKSIQVLNSLGQVLRNEKLNSNRTIDVSNLPMGDYFVRFSVEEDLVMFPFVKM